MTNIELVVPIIVWLIFIYNLRNTPLKYLAIPLTLSMGQSLFLSFYGTQVQVPFTSILINFRLFDFLVFVICTIVLTKNSCIVGISPVNAYLRKYIYAFIFILITGKLALLVLYGSALKGGILLTIVDIMRIPIYILMWNAILRRTYMNDIDKMLNVISILTVVASVLYMLYASGYVDVYSRDPYRVYTFGTSTLIRDFRTMPSWLAYVYCWILSRNNRSTIMILPVLMLASIHTYTRGMIIMFLLITIYYCYQHRQRIYRAKYVYGSVLVFALFAAIFSTQLSAQYEFISERVESDLDRAAEETSLASRWQALSTYHSRLPIPMRLFGVAGVYSEETRFVSHEEDSIILGDSIPLHVLYLAGYVGIIALYMTIIKAIKATCSNSAERNACSRYSALIHYSMIVVIGLSLIGAIGIYDNAMQFTFIIALMSRLISNKPSRNRCLKTSTDRQSSSYSIALPVRQNILL